MSLPEKSTAIRASRHGKAQGKLASALRLQRLLTEISSRFVTRPESETREIIESAQQMICEALCLDRSTLWLFSEDGVEMALSCYWQRPGSPPLRRNYVTRGNLPWADRQIREGKSFRFSSLAELPPEADQDREILIQYGTKSNVTFPLVTHGRVFGALAFATLTAERRWTDEEVASMGLISQIFSHVIGKRRAEERAEQLRDEIQRSANWPPRWRTNSTSRSPPSSPTRRPPGVSSPREPPIPGKSSSSLMTSSVPTSAPPR
jgi:GAF domain-containing protein